MALTDEQKDKLRALKKDLSLSKVEEFVTALEAFLDAIGEDSSRDGLKETPFRFSKAMLEYTEGYNENPREHLRKTFDVDHKEMVIVKDIEFHSLCEHHLAPFYGVAHVGYIPNEKITGLSKIARLVDGYAKRLQVQERLTSQIADAMYEELEAQGVMVVIEAKHYCMCGRGVRKSTASTVTSAVRGEYENPEVRAEFLDLIK